jgi:hypothetical protein
MQPELFLDQQSLGKIIIPSVVIPLSSGEHEIHVRYETEWGPEIEPAGEWHTIVKAKENQFLEMHVLLAPPILSQIRVLNQDQEALFNTFISSPSPEMVRSTWQEDDTLKIDFLWGVQERGVVEVLSGAYITNSSQGIDVTSLLGIGENDTVELSFDAKGERGGERVTFFCGGIGIDSLRPSKTLEVQLSATNWKRFTISLPANRLHQLVGGFGVEAKFRDNSRNWISLCVRDAALTLRQN